MAISVNAPRQVGVITPGFYKRRLRKGGPFVAVKFFYAGGAIRVEVDGETQTLGGEPFNPWEEWPMAWPSDAQEHAYFASLRTWAREHAPGHPAAQPWRRIDLHAMPARRRR